MGSVTLAGRNPPGNGYAGRSNAGTPEEIFTRRVSMGGPDADDLSVFVCVRYLPGGVYAT